MNTDTISVGIIGCGVIAPPHIESFRSCEGVEVLAVCDPQVEKARKLADQYGIPRVAASLEELLAMDGLHAVSVCSGHAEHAAAVTRAAEADKHVLCEKPLATHGEDLDALEKLERDFPALVFEGVFQHRFDACYRFVREVVQHGHLGPLLLIDAHLSCHRSRDYYLDSDWRGRWETEGGSLLINQAIHFLDLVGWVGGGVKSVNAVTRNLAHENLIETEDTAVLSMELGSGALGSFHGSSGSHRKWSSRMHFVGTDAEIIVEDGRVASVLARSEALAGELRTGAEELEEATRLASVKSHYGPSHPRMIADFIDSIRRGRQATVPFAEARKAVDLVLAAYRSCREGRSVTLEETD
ncbi:MAG: Gfo/Idh/MocA family oxidoreductase [Opitutales bacterium]|nr:Gfo/Idh/MocA family oxidoreductase [Opitutales bacterium]